MSKFLSAFHRIPHEADPDRAAQALAAIAPDLIVASSRVETEGAAGHVCARLNWPESFPRHGESLLQGKLLEAAPDWDRPGTPLPSGSYAMIRGDERAVEACTDTYGSRSLYIHHDRDSFAVSNSQLALTQYIGRFSYDARVAPWIIATGTPGPDLSYNAHLRLLPPGTIARLRREDWQLDIETAPIAYAPGRFDEDRAMEDLDACLNRIMGHFDASEADSIMLGLSGGYDSRAVGLYLHKTAPKAGWRSFSGGASDALQNPGSDAAIGARVAAAFGFAHRFFSSEGSDEPMAARLRRFVLCSEGRTDQFRGYSNGMAQFHDMFRNGMLLTLRGDQAFGSGFLPADTFAVRRNYGAFLAEEIPALRPRLNEFGWADQVFPARFDKRENEALEDYRDRFQRMYYATYVLGALNETKAAFVDALTPLACGEILRFAESLPPEFRTQKRLFAKLIDREGPDIPYAQGQESNILPDVLKDPDCIRELTASLDSPAAETCFGRPFLSWLKREIAMTRNPVMRAWKGGPDRVLARLRRTRSSTPPLRLRPMKLAMRVHMASTMYDRLTESAAMSTIRTERNET